MKPLKYAAVGTLIVVLLVSFMCLAVFCAYAKKYWEKLPDISVLQQIMDGEKNIIVRNNSGEYLFEYGAEITGEQIIVPLDSISPALIASTIATEDRMFWKNPGIDLFSIVKAFFNNLFSKRVLGASTITQQLVRNTMFSPETRFQRTGERKFAEIMLALFVTRVYPKEKILELYLNETYYGRGAIGVEAAARIYYGTTAALLTQEEAAFIAGLPQAPSYYGDIENFQATKQRQQLVLTMTKEFSDYAGCINVGSNRPKYCFPTN